MTDLIPNNLNCKLLIVTEDPKFSKFITKKLVTDISGIYSASSSKEAISILSKNKINLIFVCQKLPDISSIDFLIYLKREFPDLIRIFILEDLDEHVFANAVNEGEVFRILKKDYDKDRILKVLN
ncbi:response regulator, partial [bacterium]|nr:response regulator [bacterium]